MEKLIAAIVLIAESLKRIADSMTADKSPTTPAEEPKTRRSRKADPEPEPEPEAETEAESEPEAEADVTADDVTAEEEEEIKVEDLQALAQKAVKKGKVADIKAWLTKRKAASVGTMDPKHYSDAKTFLTKLAG
jgi:FtsZ-interacting cell division protein YlmF